MSELNGATGNRAASHACATVAVRLDVDDAWKSTLVDIIDPYWTLEAQENIYTPFTISLESRSSASTLSCELQLDRPRCLLHIAPLCCPLLNTNHARPPTK